MQETIYTKLQSGISSQISALNAVLKSGAKSIGRCSSPDIPLPCLCPDGKTLINEFNETEAQNVGVMSIISKTKKKTRTGVCEKDEGLYHIKKSWLYEAAVNWISGLNEVEITNSTLTPSPSTGGYTLTLPVSIPKLYLSFNLHTCIFFNLCTPLINSNNALSTSAFNATISLSLPCSSSPPYFPRVSVDAVEFAPDVVIQPIQRTRDCRRGR
ncbi:hypothetical protein BKA69DRAFT_546578 [Paraphysoderma sedebokerense]|nr:hypothetical protein BKA69DRAFT_546578 [Paraphysoderma sedebokerense]